MVAVSELHVSAPSALDARRCGDLLHCRRVVAVVDTATELLRSDSELLRMTSGVEQVDVLVVLDDAPLPYAVPVEPFAATIPLTVVAGTGFDSDVDDDVDEGRGGLARAELDRLEVPGLSVHHLGLRIPLGTGAESDVVAALSELVGFDPEPGVYCLAPDVSTADPVRLVVGAAVRRIAQVYGLPMMRYRSAGLAVVPDPRPPGND